ncbi:MAG: FAD-dependent oxidoreductase, partial [Comamonadaceae bacterium]
MRVIVLGAGLLGVTSAYYLQQLGHDVTVVDRHPTPCAKARGRVTASDNRLPAPRKPAPGRLATAVAKLWKALQRRAGPIATAFGPPRPDPVENMVRLGAYSRETVRELRDDAGVPGTPRSAGLLKFYMDKRAFEDVMARAPRLHAMGCQALLVSADEAVRVEPALWAMRAQLAGASYLAEDPERDPAPTATSLAFLCRAAGVRFLTGHT